MASRVDYYVEKATSHHIFMLFLPPLLSRLAVFPTPIPPLFFLSANKIKQKYNLGNPDKELYMRGSSK